VPQIACRVSHQPSKEILNALEANELDLGVLCPPKRLPQTLRITHKFEDAFTLIVSTKIAENFECQKNRKLRDAWLKKQDWLLIEESSNTGQRLRSWMFKQSWKFEPTMQLDNFDLII